MWLKVLLQEFIDVVQSEQVPRTVRILCTILISILFLVGITSLFLLAFVIEGQSVLRRVAFFLLGLGILGYYLDFLKALMSGRKGE